MKFCATPFLTANENKRFETLIFLEFLRRFTPSEKAKANVGTFGCLAVFVEMAPGHLCVFSVAAVFSWTNFHFFRGRSSTQKFASQRVEQDISNCRTPPCPSIERETLALLRAGPPKKGVFFQPALTDAS